MLGGRTVVVTARMVHEQIGTLVRALVHARIRWRWLRRLGQTLQMETWSEGSRARVAVLVTT